MTRKVLVTGGAGYIGSHTCKALAAAGYTPVAYDNLDYGHEWAVRWGPFVRGDILDADGLSAAFAAHRPVAVVHFAAYTYVGESVRDPLRYYRNNVLGSLQLLSSMRAHGVGKIVYSSTCATYGIPRSTPIAEDMPQVPINPYGQTKLAVERMLADCANAHGLGYCALRYFNAAGADSAAEIGEDHAPETHLIPLAIATLLDRAASLEVYGRDYETPDGSAIRDYVHVADLARTHVAALDYLLAGGAPVALNVGSGKGASVLEAIAAVERQSGRKVRWKFGPRRAGDPAILVADPSRLKAVLNVDPASFADLDDIVASAWQWHSRHLARQHPVSG